MGTNLQAGGKSGDTNRRYSAIALRLKLARPRSACRFFRIVRGEITEEPGLSEQARNNFPEGLGVAAREISMHHHDQVDSIRHLGPVQANVLPKPPLDAISSNSAAEARSDRKPEPPPRAAPPLHEHTEASGRHLFAAADDFPKLLRGANTVRPREPKPHLRSPSAAFSPWPVGGPRLAGPPCSSSAGENRACAFA